MTSPEEAPAVAAADEPKDNKKLVALGGVAGALLLGFAGYHFLLSGGDSTEDGYVVPSASKVVTPAPKAGAVVAKPAAAKVVPPATSVKIGRDPFLALYRVPVEKPATAVTPTTDTPTTPTTGTDTATSEPYALKLVSITGASNDAKVYAFTVDGAAKSVVAAQKFGKYGELVTLAYTKDAKGKVTGALIQVGDDDPTTIKLGEKITVL